MIPGILAAAVARAVSTDDVRSLMLGMGPTAYYRHAEPSGSLVMMDETGKYHGAYTAPGNGGYPSLYDGGPTAMAGGLGVGLRAFADRDLPTSNAVTLTTIVRLSNVTATRPIGIVVDNGSPRQYQWRTNSGVVEFVRINNFVGPTQTVSLGAALAENETYFLALVIESSGAARMYVDGSLAGIAAIDPMSFGGAATKMSIGYSSGMAAFADGYFSESALFPRALSAQEILRLARAAGF